jgi:hypothetical protein
MIVDFQIQIMSFLYILILSFFLIAIHPLRQIPSSTNNLVLLKYSLYIILDSKKKIYPTLFRRDFVVFYNMRDTKSVNLDVEGKI